MRAAVESARRLLPGLPPFAGGKSFGGRMTSQVQAEAALPDIRGLVFLGFPLHPTNRPSQDRARHLTAVQIPMLFVQGTRDSLADPQLLAGVVGALGSRATLQWIDEADHSFHVPARSGRTDAEVLGSVLDGIAAWMRPVRKR